ASRTELRAESGACWPAATLGLDGFLNAARQSTARSRLSRRLKELDRIAVGVFDLDLPAARAGLHLVAEAQSRLFQRRDAPRQIRNLQHHTIPAAGLLTATVRQRARSRRARTAEENGYATE